jgi:DNA-binding IscR family transcriptional regulator
VRGECDQTDRCTIREPLRRVNESIEQVLKGISISEMRDEQEIHRAKDLVRINN